MAFLETTKLTQISRPHLKKLAELTGESVHLAVLDGSEIVFLERIETPKSISMAQQKVGKRFPAYATAVGKVLLASLDAQKREQLLENVKMEPITEYTITDKKMLEEQLCKVRAQGYALDDKEMHEWCRCLAAPVKNYQDRVVAAISISGLAMTITDDKLDLLASQVNDIAAEISGNLGYRKN